MKTCRIIQPIEVNNPTKPIKGVYLTGRQLDNLYRMDVRRYAQDFSDVVKSFNNISHMVHVNANLTGSGCYVELPQTATS